MRVCAVNGFPHGNSTTRIKVLEALAAIADGASEIDTVVNVGKVKSADWSYVGVELKALNQAVVGENALLKVIFETDFLNEDEIIRLCELSTEAGAAFVKTSTGFGFVKRPGGGYDYTGATLRQIDLMRMHSGPGVQVKASGGIRTLDNLLAARAHGATRVGMSATEAVLKEAAARLGLAPHTGRRGTLRRSGRVLRWRFFALRIHAYDRRTKRHGFH